ncbi:MAG: hypothetical protein K6C30_01620 [Bacteroidaceae bacterium]|nr:hypothetical protein [Bacteroidaceae bacterium]
MLFLLGAAMVCAQNPYLPLWEHVPDGEPRVFEDPDRPGHLRAYIIGSHDTHYTEYCGNDVRLWSAPVEDLSQWTDEGPIFSYFVDGRWDTMFAPDLVEVSDKRTGKKTYWLYPHSRGWRRVAMVCKSDRPDGPFTPVNLTADGRACVEGSLIDFDPSVFVETISDKKDPDFARGYRAYVYYGFQHSTAYELDPDNMYAVRPGTQVHDYFLPASSSYGQVRDPEGTRYTALCEGQNPGDFNFFEASSIRKVGNKYVMVFSGYSGPDYGLGSTNSALRYAYGDSPLGPWRSGGVLVDSRGVVPNEDGTHLTTTNAAHNTHGSLQQINGQWYVFYHRPPRGFANARQSMVAPVKIEWDKKPVAKGGGVRIVAYDPFAKDESWTASASDGTCYTGAEVTSEGFQIYGLPPYAYYSAGVACYMSGPGSNNWLQDNHDVWCNHMDLAGLKNGGVVGFKYFGFGGLAADAKGVRAFGGIKKGDHALLNLHLTPSGRGAFRIHVMLDGPYANAVWNGREVAVLTVPADAPREPRMYSVETNALEGLAGKHAIYLVVEGPEVEEPQPQRPQFGRRQQPQRPQGLCDLHGIGFSKDGSLSVPIELQRGMRTVSITADGRPLNVPETPIYTTNENGYTKANHYQLYAPLKEGSVLKATSPLPGVEFEVSAINAGRAVVRATYRGQEKIYLIN